MTESRAELLRQAGEKELLAQRFTNYAKGLATYFIAIERSYGRGGTWKGPAAQRYEGDLRVRRREIEDLEQDCLAAAKNLRRTASDLRTQADNAPA